MDVPFALICATSLTEGVNDWGCLHAANKDRTMSSVHILYFLISYFFPYSVGRQPIYFLKRAAK